MIKINDPFKVSVQIDIKFHLLHMSKTKTKLLGFCLELVSNPSIGILCQYFLVLVLGLPLFRSCPYTSVLMITT